MHIHPIDLSCEQSCLISTCAGTDLHDNVLLIIRILGQKQDLHLLFQLYDPLLRVRHLFLEHLTHLIIRLALQHGETVFYGFLTFPIFCVGIHQRLQVRLLLHQLAETILVIDYRRFGQFVGDLFKPSYQIFQFIKHLFSSISLTTVHAAHDPVKSCQILNHAHLCKMFLHKGADRFSLIVTDLKEQPSAFS